MENKKRTKRDSQPLFEATQVHERQEILFEVKSTLALIFFLTFTSLLPDLCVV